MDCLGKKKKKEKMYRVADAFQELSLKNNPIPPDLEQITLAIVSS
jgi:hypothetical protein